MALLGISALAGAYTLQLCSQLPGMRLCIFLVPISLAALILRRTRLAGAYLSGLLLLAFSSHAVIDDRLPQELAGKTFTFSARIADFPAEQGAAMRFVVEPLGRPDLPRRIRLSWYEATLRPAPGETWQLQARLRRPRGYSNPGGFDYEAWLFRQAIAATGYVINGSINRSLSDQAVDPVSRLRHRYLRRIETRLPDDDASAVLLAVGIGARHRITSEQWQRYASTGTSHLMAISGLHIGLAAGGAFFLCWALLALVCRRSNIRDRATMFAAVAALAYAEISGFAVPARRAVLMTAVIVLAALLRRQVSSARLLGICCLAILLSDPLAILAPGFKLSFVAVAILFWHMRVTRIPVHVGKNRNLAMLWNGIRRLSSTQVALLFGMFPLTAMLFDRVAILAPFVNLIALPVFNFLTVPACLLGLLLDGPAQAAGDVLLSLAHRSVAAVLRVVACADALPFADIRIARPAGLMAVAALLPSLWSLAPPGWPGRGLAWVAAVSMILFRPAPPPVDCVDLSVLDVGQGLAVVLRTRRHAVVFDTGPSFRSGGDTGRLVLVPFLRSIGIKSIDLLIVSHADQDHAGGVQSLIQEINTRAVLTGEALENIAVPQARCQANDRWQWDGVDFVFVHPKDAGRWRGNNASCVLEIRVARHRILLTGDIESPVEKLLAGGDILTQSDIVLIPHHGSRTSSSDEFIRRVRPQVAVVSAGSENRWGFPKDDIVSAWKRAGAVVLNTASSGAISCRICGNEGVRQFVEQRRHDRKYWHDYSGK